MANLEDQQPKKKKKKKKGAASALPRQSTPINKIVEIKESHIHPPEEHGKPFELSWRWHVTTLVIIYTSLTLLLYSYIQVIQYYSKKHISIADAIKSRIEEINKSPEEASSTYKLIEEKRKPFDDKIKEIVKLSNFCQQSQNKEEKDVKDALPSFDVLKNSLSGIVSNLKEIAPFYSDIMKRDIHNEDLLKNLVKFNKVGTSLQTNINVSLEQLKKELSLYEMQNAYSRNLSSLMPMMKQIIKLENNMQGFYNVEDASDMIIEQLIQSVSNDRRSLDGHFRLGMAYLDKSWQDQALEEFIKVIKFDHRKKRTNEAFEKMEALVKTEPDKVYVDAYFYIAVAKLIVKDYSAASSNLENLINHPANSIWKSESRKLKAMIDRNDKGSIKFYLQEQLWI